MKVPIFIRVGSSEPASGVLATGELGWDDSGKILYAGQTAGAAILVGPGCGSSTGEMLSVTINTNPYLVTIPVTATTTQVKLLVPQLWQSQVLTMQPNFAPGFVGQKIDVFLDENSLGNVIFPRDSDPSNPGSGLSLVEASSPLNLHEWTTFLCNGKYWCQGFAPERFA